MAWWTIKKHSVCKICGVHFEPVTGYESRWGDLCSVHREPVRKRDELHDATMIWAEQNWGRLSKMMEDENKQQAELMNQAFNKAMNDSSAGVASQMYNAANQTNVAGNFYQASRFTI